jgi:hypothetical protein
LIVLLEQHREHILLLKNQWTNSFVSATRLDWHIRHSNLRAEGIGSAPVDGQNLTWLTTMTVDNENNLFVKEVPEEGLEVPVLLTGSDDEDQLDDDDGAERDADDLRVLQSSGDNEKWSLKPRLIRQTLEAGSARSLELRMMWKDLEDLKYDEDICSFLDAVHGPSDVQPLQSSAKHFLGLGERGTFFFEPADILCVAKRRAMLNDQCINGGALLLQDLISCQQTDDTRIITCTILSTYDLPRILHNAPDDEIVEIIL